jgi:hypothetical protein
MSWVMALRTSCGSVSTPVIASSGVFKWVQRKRAFYIVGIVGNAKGKGLKSQNILLFYL